jgi:hypothetical protein
MTITMKEVIRKEATSVWKSIRVEERLKVTLEDFTLRVNTTEPRRNYSPAELKPIFEELKNELPPSTTLCQCTGESCGHHSPEQPCTNEAVPPVAVVLDLATNRPVPSSERALCLACHAANAETAGDID